MHAHHSVAGHLPNPFPRCLSPRRSRRRARQPRRRVSRRPRRLRRPACRGTWQQRCYGARGHGDLERRSAARLEGAEPRQRCACRCRARQRAADRAAAQRGSHADDWPRHVRHRQCADHHVSFRDSTPQLFAEFGIIQAACCVASVCTRRGGCLLFSFVPGAWTPHTLPVRYPFGPAPCKRACGCRTHGMASLARATQCKHNVAPPGGGADDISN